MKATEAQLLTFLQKSCQFIIPIYQRPYSWTLKQCQQLWQDIHNAGQENNILGHFLGSVVYVEKGLYNVSAIPQLLVIDGQQRLTSISLLVTALSSALADGATVEGINSRKLANRYLFNADEDGNERFKLLLTRTDRQTLTALVDQQPPPKERSLRITENFDYFQSQIKEHMANHQNSLDIIYQGLAKLLVVDISLDRANDNPQLIFESLNSTGLDLSQADLIRNYVLMGLEPTEQQKLYETYWYPMEGSFGQADYTRLFDRFMRDYLTVKTEVIPNIKEVYAAFKQYVNRKDIGTISDVLADIHRHSGYFVAIALDKEEDRELAAHFKDINELKVDVAYPFLLELYHDYQEDILSKDELRQALLLVESYVFRRAVCGIPTNSLNKTFLNLARAIDKDHYIESLHAQLMLMKSYRRFPNDEEFTRELHVRDLYNFRSRNYWLRRLENHGRKERVYVEDYTIEHIMPQNPNLSTDWHNELGPDWERIHGQYLHTLGNLTLTGYNSEMSDRPFAQKRDMHGGFAQSPLRLNQGLGQVQQWDEAAIQQRADRLSERVIQVWPAPQLPDAVLATYQPEKGQTTYTLADHTHLQGSIRKLFDHFSKQVLNLDASVTQEIFKQYIAFKANTNFVDVVPQSRRLRLSLNMRFDQINDPRGLCIDITNKGRWGNGDVEVGLDSDEELPYVMGLVKQALDLQLFTDQA